MVNCRPTRKTSNNTVHNVGIKTNRRAQRGEVLWTELVALFDDPPAAVGGTARDHVETALDAIWIPKAKRWAVLRPKYGQPARAFWLNSRRRPNVQLDIDTRTGLLTATAIATVEGNRELFWYYKLW